MWKEWSERIPLPEPLKLAQDREQSLDLCSITDILRSIAILARPWSNTDRSASTYTLIHGHALVCFGELDLSLIMERETNADQRQLTPHNILPASQLHEQWSANVPFQ